MASTGEERATLAFRARFHAEPSIVARAPGRVNLIGEHVDYNEGFVLPVAIDRAAWVAAAPADGDAVTIEAVDLAESVSFDVDETNEKRDIRGEPLPRWALYAAGVANELARRGHRVRGIDAALASDVPIGAGLSSSAAIEVAFATTWRRLGNLAIDSLELAELCQQAESRYVGVRCGLMDQYVSVHGEAGHALLLDCRSLDSKTVRLPAGVRLVVADSKVRRELARPSSTSAAANVSSPWRVCAPCCRGFGAFVTSRPTTSRATAACSARRSAAAPATSSARLPAFAT